MSRMVPSRHVHITAKKFSSIRPTLRNRSSSPRGVGTVSSGRPSNKLKCLCATSVFLSGHGFIRAANARKSVRLQPLRDDLASCHKGSEGQAEKVYSSLG